MSSCKRAATSAAALSIFIAASPAFADLTAEQVWADWQDYMASTGYAVDATTSRSGDTLTVSDLSMSIAIPEEDVDVSVTMQEFSLTENGDGTVAISMPPVTPLVVSISDGSGEGVDINLDYITSALAMNVSGDANDMVYTYSAAEVAVKLADVSYAGQSVDIGTAMMSFALGVVLDGFQVSDLIWSIIDAPGQLPHDPATVILETSGLVKLFFDLMDPEQMVMVESGEAMPGELNELTLHELEVSAAGATLTGQGAFTFDNTDLSTFDGLPAPTGSVDLMLVGGNGLLDTLVAMGLIPEEEAMVARMMMGLFAIPGDGEDTLTSKIEVNGDGSISANGQRLR